jgi:hypothetical protein
MSQILLQRQRELAIGKIRVVLEMDQLKEQNIEKQFLKSIERHGVLEQVMMNLQGLRQK